MATSVPTSSISGSRIREVLETYTSEVGGIDLADHVFVLESGLMFRLPLFVSQPIEPVDIPPAAAAPLNDIELTAALTTPIRQMWYRPEHLEPDPILIEMESGYWIWSVSGSPHGISDAGLYIQTSCPWDAASLLPYVQ